MAKLFEIVNCDSFYSVYGLMSTAARREVGHWCDRKNLPIMVQYGADESLRELSEYDRECGCENNWETNDGLPLRFKEAAEFAHYLWIWMDGDIEENAEYFFANRLGLDMCVYCERLREDEGENHNGINCRTLGIKENTTRMMSEFQNLSAQARAAILAQILSWQNFKVIFKVVD